MGNTVAEAAANVRRAHQLAEQQQQQQQQQQTPAQQRQQAAAEQRERERVARANGTTVGLPAPPPLRMLYASSFSRKREKTRKNVDLPQKSIFPSETEKSQPPSTSGCLTPEPGQLWRNCFYPELDPAPVVV